MDIQALRTQAKQHIDAAKSLSAGYTGDPNDMPKDLAAQITGHLGKFDELKVLIEMQSKAAAADSWLNEPSEQPAIHAISRPSGPNEGLADVDEKAYRSFKINERTPWEKEIRFFVPLAVDTKDYKSAFKAYLLKGFGNLGPNDRKTLTEGTDTAGGFLVDEDFQTMLIKKMAARAAVRSLARVVQTNSSTIQWPRVNYASGTNDTSGKIFTSGARITWTGEQPASSTAANVTDPVFGQITIPVNTAMARMPISNDLIEDAVFDVNGYASDILAEAFALDEDNVFLNGSGAGQPMGLLTEINGNGPGYVVTGTQNALTTSGDAHEGVRINNCYYNTPAQYRGRCVWMMSSLTLGAVDNLVDAQDRPIIGPLTGISMVNSEPGSLKGKPIIVDEFMPELTASTDTDSVMFGDFSGYTIVDRVAMSISRLTELYAETNLTVLLARRRVGGYCTEPYKFKSLRAAAS